MGADYSGKMDRVPTGLLLLAVILVIITGMAIIMDVMFILLGTILILTVVGSVVGIPLLALAIVDLIISLILFIGAIGVFFRRRWGYYIILIFSSLPSCNARVPSP